MDKPIKMGEKRKSLCAHLKNTDRESYRGYDGDMCPQPAQQ